MTPSVNIKVSELDEKIEPNLTYKLDLEQKGIYGKVEPI